MVNYDPSVSGTLKVVVTDDNGTGASTEITYNVQKDQFSEELVDKDTLLAVFCGAPTDATCQAANVSRYGAKRFGK